jgi:hypothetical protein
LLPMQEIMLTKQSKVRTHKPDFQQSWQPEISYRIDTPGVTFTSKTLMTLSEDLPEYSFKSRVPCVWFTFIWGHYVSVDSQRLTAKKHGWDKSWKLPWLRAVACYSPVQKACAARLHL